MVTFQKFLDIHRTQKEVILFSKWGFSFFFLIHSNKTFSADYTEQQEIPNAQILYTKQDWNTDAKRNSAFLLIYVTILWDKHLIFSSVYMSKIVHVFTNLVKDNCTVVETKFSKDNTGRKGISKSMHFYVCHICMRMQISKIGISPFNM
jgi:hypothetical protein